MTLDIAPRSPLHLTPAPEDPAAPEPPAALAAAAHQYGTPLYATHMETLARNAAELEDAFPRSWMVQYSLKANDLPALVRRLAARGWGANVVSIGEWRLARRAGLPNARITFEGIGKTDDQLREIIRSAAGGTPLRWVAIESAEEAAALVDLARHAGLGRAGVPPLDILLRLNPRVEPDTHESLAVGRATSKFGMLADEITALVGSDTLDSAVVNLRGLHVHVGSQLSAVDAWVEGTCRALELIQELGPAPWRMDTVDLGGGFPAGLASPRPADFADRLARTLSSAGLTLPPRVAIEPGRYPVGTAGWIAATVLHVRRRGGGQQVVLDAGMTELIRPALYGSRHPAYALSTAALSTAGGAEGELLETRLEGPVCESGDTLGVHRLPPLRRGDLVAIGGAGAYAASLSSRYNGRARAPEVFIEDDGRLTLAQPREEVA